ncbi:MAG: TonB C-terminal domain-containing protein [Candidatus Hydrogenedentes bacterium]|nr:TonB C-terminal domain-containing protein [Candidatus Hydrogenedentota bacterium]
MNYSTRIKIAAVFSLLIHAAGVGLLRQTYTPREYIPAAAPEPIVLDLQPEAQPSPPPQQFVDVATPAEAPPQVTEHIAVENAEAMDLALREAERPAPALEEDEFDALPQPVAPPAPPEPDTTSPAQESKEETEKKEETRTKEPVREVETPAKEELPEAEETPPAPKAPEGPIKIAQAQPMPAQRPEKGKTRERGGVSKQGQTNFDAIQSEIAPYLKHVRERVEQQWNQMLYTRYSGTSPVKAVIDCAINAEGELVSVNVVGTDNDKLYSALCRDAVQRAGPFGPFPFEVPDIYRGKNLEIRWTFSFL